MKPEKAMALAALGTVLQGISACQGYIPVNVMEETVDNCMTQINEILDPDNPTEEMPS